MTRAESGYSRIDQARDPSSYVRRLDATAAHEFWARIKAHSFDLLELHEGDHALDVGCGTGDDVRVMARMVGPFGQAVGIDNSATMIAEAKSRSAGHGLGGAFMQGDAHQLSFTDDSFDACRAERVFQHLSDPVSGFKELVRVARPGARVVVIEPDYGTLSIEGADPVVTRHIRQSRCQHYRSGRIGRQLPAIFQDHGVDRVSVELLTLSVTALEERERSMLRAYAHEAYAAGAITRIEADTWLADLDAAGIVDRYRRAITVFVVSGRNPPAHIQS